MGKLAPSRCASPNNQNDCAAILFAGKGLDSAYMDRSPSVSNSFPPQEHVIMSRTLKGLLLGMLLFTPMLAQGAPGEMLEVKGRLATNDPLDPVRRKPAKIHEV